MNAVADRVVAEVRAALDGRQIVWFGTRGEDGEALLRFPELVASFAVTAPLRSGRLAESANVTLEQLSGHRPDLDRHDIDEAAGESARRFRAGLLRQVSARCAVVTYRPAQLVSTMAFSMTDTMTLAGLFKDRQVAFEHKPWVESALEGRGVRTLGWRYVANEHSMRAMRLADAGPVILRTNRSSGGVGIVHAPDRDTVSARWPEDDEGFIGVAPFVADAVPINLAGCVFGNGLVRLQAPSVQLIGIDGCTDRPFGFCGNDFGAASALPATALEQLDAMARDVGGWLHDERYVGAFGVDALWADGKVHFTEVNARFQGSSALSAVVADEVGQPDLFVDHLGASLGLCPADPGLTLTEWTRRQSPRAHLVVHNVTGGTLRRTRALVRPAAQRDVALAQVLPLDVAAEPGSTLYRTVFDRSITSTGFDVDPSVQALVRTLNDNFEVPMAAREARSDV